MIKRWISVLVGPVLRWRRRVLWCVDKHTARGLECQRQRIESRQGVHRKG